MGIIANKHKLVIFDFDKTLIRESSIEVAAKEFGFEEELQKLRADYQRGKIKDYNITLELANLIKGRAENDFRRIFNKISLRRTAKRVIDQLKKRQYGVGIISVAFSPVVHYFADKLGIDKNNIICPILVTDKNKKYTGEIIAKTKHHSKCCDGIICKADAAKELMKKLNVKPEECISVGDGKSDECLFRACGLSLAYKPPIPIGDIRILNLAEVLIYAE